MTLAEEIENLLAGAKTKYQNAKATLYTAQGQPIYAPDEQSRRLAAAQAEFDATYQAVETKLTDVEVKSNEVLEIEDVDSVSALTPLELQSANQMASFVKETVAEMTLEELTHRLQVTAKLPGDKVLKWLYVRYADARLKGDVVSLVTSNHIAAVNGQATEKFSGDVFAAAQEALKQLKSSFSVYSTTRERSIAEARENKNAVRQVRNELLIQQYIDSHNG